MSTTTPQLEQVDVRGPRFAAWVTTGVLVLTLVLSTFSLPTATVLLALQAIVFAVGAVLGPKRSPYGQIFGKLVAPRISPVSEREPVAPLASLSSSASSSPWQARSVSWPGRRSSAPSPRASPCSRPCSTPRSASASAARSTHWSPGCEIPAALPPRESACHTTPLNPCWISTDARPHRKEHHGSLRRPSLR